MPFFKDKRDEDTPQKKSVDVECARRLANAIRQNKKQDRPISIKGWAYHFKHLRDADGVPQEKIVLVLNWYIDHINDEGLPPAHTARSFRAMFSSIERAMSKRDGDVIQLSLTNITQDAKGIAARVKKYGWPGPLWKFVPLVAQISLDNYVPFRDQVRQLVKEMEPEGISVNPDTGRRIIKHSHLFYFAQHLIEGRKLGTPEHFVEVWLVDALTWIKRHPEWRGNLKDFAFRTDHEKFQWMGNDWSVQYTGTPEFWDKLLERMNHAK